MKRKYQDYPKKINLQSLKIAREEKINFFLDNKYFNVLNIKAALVSENLNFLENNSFKGGLLRYDFYA